MDHLVFSWIFFFLFDALKPQNQIYNQTVLKKICYTLFFLYCLTEQHLFLLMKQRRQWCSCFCPRPGKERSSLYVYKIVGKTRLCSLYHVYDVVTSHKLWSTRLSS